MSVLTTHKPIRIEPVAQLATHFIGDNPITAWGADTEYRYAFGTHRDNGALVAYRTLKFEHNWEKVL
jgi:hypothetical protein